MNKYSGTTDKTMTQRVAGPGVAMRWKCLHCEQVRDYLGSRGVGIKKRCAVCVAKREAV